MKWWQKLGRWLKAAAQAALWLAGILAGLFIVKEAGPVLWEAGKKLLQAITDTVHSPMPFHRVPGHPELLDVVAPWGTERATLPAGMASDKVVAAEAVKGEVVKVEALHEVTDRRAMLSTPGGAGSGS